MHVHVAQLIIINNNIATLALIVKKGVAWGKGILL